MSGTDYKSAGVDIDAGHETVRRIKSIARSTFTPGVLSEIGSFGGLFTLAGGGWADPVLVSSADGVGTKLKVAFLAGVHDTIGQDLVNHCVNDILVQGATPLFFLDYLATGRLSPDVAEQIVIGLAKACRENGCALLGGETAEMPGIYQPGDYDLAGFAVGAAERGALLPRDVAPGDILLGIASSGVHSNGYSLVRKIVAHAGLTFDARAPFAPEHTLGEILLAPTRLYVKSCLAAIRESGGVKALAHITGGGFPDNIPRVLPKGVGARIDLEQVPVLPVFKWLAQAGNVEQNEMLRTFNCGIGMIAVVDQAKADAAATILRREGETVVTLGDLVAVAEGGAQVAYRGTLSLG